MVAVDEVATKSVPKTYSQCTKSCWAPEFGSHGKWRGQHKRRQDTVINVVTLICMKMWCAIRVATCMSVGNLGVDDIKLG